MIIGALLPSNQLAKFIAMEKAKGKGKNFLLRELLLHRLAQPPVLPLSSQIKSNVPAPNSLPYFMETGERDRLHHMTDM